MSLLCVKVCFNHRTFSLSIVPGHRETVEISEFFFAVDENAEFQEQGHKLHDVMVCSVPCKHRKGLFHFSFWFSETRGLPPTH
jgi:hypothetical protein